MIGQTVSHYRILDKLGEGGMGVVYKAEDTRLKRTVALKFLPAHLSASEQDKARFLQEAQSASSINHPNICTIHDIQEHESQMFIVMEYVEGKTLHETPGVSEKEAIEIGAQIAEGLAAAHEKGIVHRDVKPENIMVRKDGRVQIMDFGLAKLRGVSRLTKEGSTVGTAGYMSPEQVQGTDVDARSDIFSLGVVLYELFTGRLPFRGVHETAMAYEIVNVDAPPMRTAKPDINPELDRIVAGCLEKNPAERMQSAKQVAVDLRRSARDSGKHAVSREMHAASPQGNESAPGGRKRISRLIGAGLLVICLAAVAIWYAGSHTETIGSMMVLPFENVGGNADLEYLSDGVTEGIINALAKDQQLRVIPRSASFRFKGSSKDPGAIGKELGVDAVLSGRIVQRGNSLDVTTELIDVHAYSQIWGENYHRTMNDLVTVQRDIIEGVRRRINQGTAGTSGENRQSMDPVAYRLYLQGRYQWNKRTAPAMEQAFGYFRQAVAADPKFALAHLGLAETYLLQGQYADKNSPDILLNAVDEARRALTLDNSLGEAHAALGLSYVYQWKWVDAEREFKLAIENAPKYATGYQWYYIYLSMHGRDDEALVKVKKAAELDPYSPIVLTNAGDAMLQRKDYASARSYLEKVFSIDPSFLFARVFMSQVLWAEGKPGAALAMLDSISQDGLSSNNLAFLSFHYAALGERAKAQQILDRLVEQDKRGNVDPLNMAMAYTGLDDNERAIAYLQKSFDQHSGLLPEIRQWEEFRPLLSDPRVQKILQGMGLPLLKE